MRATGASGPAVLRAVAICGKCEKNLNSNFARSDHVCGLQKTSNFGQGTGCVLALVHPDEEVSWRIVCRKLERRAAVEENELTYWVDSLTADDSADHDVRVLYTWLYRNSIHCSSDHPGTDPLWRHWMWRHGAWSARRKRAAELDTSALTSYKRRHIRLTSSTHVTLCILVYFAARHQFSINQSLITKGQSGHLQRYVDNT